MSVEPSLPNQVRAACASVAELARSVSIEAAEIESYAATIEAVEDAGTD